MEIENIHELINNIISIQDKKTNIDIDYKEITAEKLIAKYSNVKTPTYKLKIDGKLISKNNPYKIKYKCITCKNDNSVSLNNIIRKINKNMVCCIKCINSDIDKIESWRNTLMGISNSNGIEEISYDDFVKLSDVEFKEEDDDFQHQFYRKHLTLEEFERIRNKIVSIQADKITNISSYKYVPTLKIYNQTKYNPHLYDSINEEFIKINYIKFNCDICDNTFMNRDLYIQKNRLKILCKDCNFVNNTFKIRQFKNCNGTNITYQSKLELKFITYCNKNNIIVENGPKINYKHNNKQKRYIVDFYLPELNVLIEIKDNHHWHKENKQNGKWDAKINAVNVLVNNNKYNEFMLIYSNELIKKCDIIKKKIKEL